METAALIVAPVPTTIANAFDLLPSPSIFFSSHLSLRQVRCYSNGFIYSFVLCHQPDVVGLESKIFGSVFQYFIS